ncbi:hypothetical protein ACQ4M3_20470 [Leptolyngbya sp. AN03gr2]|uniref:hypothetical protein n=1 Tax=unclassified Leptolyngbya TaxID=2650499 RepID=UPI003D322748
MGAGNQETLLTRRVEPPFLENPGMRWIGIGLLACVGSLLIHTIIGAIGSAILPLPPNTIPRSSIGLKLLVHSTLLSFVVILIWAVWRYGKVNQQYAREVYRPAHTKWSRSYICYTCGNIFDPFPEHS